VRRGLLTLLTIALLVSAGAALASRIEVGGAQQVFYRHGSDRFGKVTFFYAVDPTHLQHPPIVNIVTITQLRFANECSRAATKVPGTIHVDKHKHFRHEAHGFIVKGRLIGGLFGGRQTVGPKVVGTIETIHDCDGDSDVVPFVAAGPRR
jgi:hypothetical protein